MNVKKALEKYGFTVEQEDGGDWAIQQYTPAGEDWGIYLGSLDDFKTFVDNFDPEKEFNTLWQAKQNGLRGVPDPAELWQDQLWKKETLNKVLEDL